MHKVSVFVVVVSLLLIVVASTSVGASVSVGVKQGDWIEYAVNILITDQASANVSVSADHNITWAKMDVTQVQGTKISLSIQTRYSNGTIIPANVTLDLQAGELGDDFIIPANLNVGDSFFDKNQGNITITSVAQRVVAGVQRNVISAATAETGYIWDQAAGVLLDAQTNLTDYTIVTTTVKTNLWQTSVVNSSPGGTPHSEPQTPKSDPTLFYVIVTIVIVVLIIVGLFIMWGRRSGKSGKP